MFRRAEKYTILGTGATTTISAGQGIARHAARSNGDGLALRGVRGRSGGVSLVELVGRLSAGRRPQNRVARYVSQAGPATPFGRPFAGVGLGTRELVQRGRSPIGDRRKGERRL